MAHQYVRFSIRDPWLAQLIRLARDGESPSTTASRLLKACLELNPEQSEMAQLRERITAIEKAIADADRSSD